MTALLEQATIDERQNSIACYPLMDRTNHATQRAVVANTKKPAQARVMKTVLVVSGKG